MSFPPDPEAEEKIRDKITRGMLPRKPPAKIWAGRGHGEVCAGCDQPIGPEQVAYEIENGHVFRMHIDCAALWEEEMRRAAG
jgi:hypothetical protein